MADLQSRTPISPETSFDIGSVSTQFTATAVLLLANQGKLSTSDPLSKHLEGLPSWSRTVTLGQLMHHVSGIPDYLGLLAARGIAFEEKTSREHVLKLISEVEFLNFKPGSRWEYSNSNYPLLAMVIEKIPGSGFPSSCSRRSSGLCSCTWWWARPVRSPVRRAPTACRRRVGLSDRRLARVRSRSRRDPVDAEHPGALGRQLPLGEAGRLPAAQGPIERRRTYG